jgi:hypothetical protein
MIFFTRENTSLLCYNARACIFLGVLNMTEITENKPWWQSRGVWGSVIAFLAIIAGAFGYTVDESLQEQIVQAIIGVAGAAGAVLAAYGRIKATKAIGKKDAK